MSRVWKILIVDDNDAMRNAMADSFADPMFAVSTAKNGVDATIMVEAESFDVIVTDVQMPKMNGLQFAANVKNSPLNSSVPMFFVSGNTNDEVLKKALEFKVVSLVPKPFNEEVFVTMVRETLEKRSSISSHNPEIVAAFVQGMGEVLAFYFNEQPIVSSVKPHQEPTVSSFASAIVSLAGKKDGGFLAMSINQLFLKEICSILFPGTRLEMKETFASDLAAEIANQIAGKVKMNLGKIGIDISVGLPQVVLGIGHKIVHRTGGSILRVDFSIKNLTTSMDFSIIRSAK